MKGRPCSLHPSSFILSDISSRPERSRKEMGRKHLFTLASLLLVAGVVVFGYQKNVPKSQAEDKNVAAVRAVIEAQAAAWNRGDVDGYMEGYAKEDETTFVSGGHVHRGGRS